MKSPARSLSNPESLPPLPPGFFLKKAVEVAKCLLGKGLLVVQRGRPLLVELVEVEAYFQEDPASHSFAGPTKRTWPMFEPGGTCYVYLSYGINFCMNVCTGPKGRGDAVLFRAARPLLGAETLGKNRVAASVRRSKKIPNEKDLLSGPGKLTQALGIGLRHNGLTFDRDDFKLVDLGHEIPAEKIVRSPRIGITKARDELLRFSILDSGWLSRKG